MGHLSQKKGHLSPNVPMHLTSLRPVIMRVFSSKMSPNVPPGAFFEKPSINDGPCGVGRDVSGAVPFTRLIGKQVLLDKNELCGAPVFSIPATTESRYDGTLPPAILGASKIYFDFERRRFGWDKLMDRAERCERLSLSADSGSSAVSTSQ